MSQNGTTGRIPFQILSDSPRSAPGRIAGLYVLLAAANIAAWAWALFAFRDYPVQLGTAFLAYTFGLRHAVDADHIAAIDNVTRKLMQDGKRPVSRLLLLAGSRDDCLAWLDRHCADRGCIQR